MKFSVTYSTIFLVFMETNIIMHHLIPMRTFWLQDSAGILHLEKLSNAGVTHVHLLPSFQFAEVDDVKENWKSVGKCSYYHLTVILPALVNFVFQTVTCALFIEMMTLSSAYGIRFPWKRHYGLGSPSKALQFMRNILGLCIPFEVMIHQQS